MDKDEIKRFFDGVIVDGITRDVIFPEDSEEGRIEVTLVAPSQTGIAPIHLSFPEEESK